MRGVTGERVSDGKILGIGVVYRWGWPGYVAFTMDPEARDHPMTLHRCALALLQVARDEGHDNVWAIADPGIGTAPRWLNVLGFKYARTIQRGDVYERVL